MPTFDEEDMLPEYKIDYSKVKPNRFAQNRIAKRRTVELDSDIADNFPSDESVNEALRFLVRITKQHQNELHDK